MVGLLTVELHVPGAQSLKYKRHALRRIKDRLKKFTSRCRKSSTSYAD